MVFKLSNELKILLKKKRPEFVKCMCENSTINELVILYKLLHYRNLDIDDAEQIIVETYTKEELSELIYNIIHRRRFWNIQTVITCVSLLINSHLWLSSFKKIRSAYKSGKEEKVSLLTGASFVLHSLFVVSDLNSLRITNKTAKQTQKINRALLDLYLQNGLPKTNKKLPKNHKVQQKKNNNKTAKQTRAPLKSNTRKK